MTGRERIMAAAKANGWTVRYYRNSEWQLMITKGRRTVMVELSVRDAVTWVSTSTQILRGSGLAARTVEILEG